MDDIAAVLERRLASIERQRGEREHAERRRRAIRVLLVEDDPMDARLVQRLLSRSHRFEVEVTHCAEPAAAIAAMRAGGHDLWLLDYWIGHVPSTRIVADAERGGAARPAVVLLTGSPMDDVEDDAYDSGATVCLGKYDVNGGTLDSAVAAALRSAERSAAVQAELHAAMQAEMRVEAERCRATMGDLAHEVGNVLNASRMTLALDAMDPSEERAREMVGELGSQIEQLHDTTRAMLHDAGLGDGGPASPPATGVEDALERIDRLCRPLVEGAGRSFELDAPSPDTAGAEGVEVAPLAQVALNLVVNAVKYSPPGGAVRVALRRDGDDLVLRVEDDGEGLTADRLAALVGRGVRGGGEVAPGHGLGLAIVAQMAARMGGCLEARPREVRRAGGRAAVLCRVPLAAGPGRIAA